MLAALLLAGLVGSHELLTNTSVPCNSGKAEVILVWAEAVEYPNVMWGVSGDVTNASTIAHSLGQTSGICNSTVEMTFACFLSARAARTYLETLPCRELLWVENGKASPLECLTDYTEREVLVKERVPQPRWQR